MDELLENIKEFLESGEENIKKKRYKAAIWDFFKAIVIMCDYIIYDRIRVLPKNHTERFSLLNKYFPNTHSKVSILFKTYVKTYNLRLGIKEVIRVKEYAYQLKNSIKNKE